MKKLINHLYMNRRLILSIQACIFAMCLSISTHAAEKSGSCGENLTWTLTGDTLEFSGTGDMMDYADGALAPWFGHAKEIETIVFSEAMTSIGDYAFFGCENVKNVEIPSSVIDIGACAFAQCKSLINLDLGDGVQTIGEGAFQECEALPEICFSNSVAAIGAKAFYRCYNISSVTVPSTIKEVGESVFSYCTGLVRATVNAPVTELPGWFFYGCSNLADVSLAAEITSVGEYAFLFCDKLNGIYTQGGNIDTVHALEKSIYEKDGAPEKELVKAHEMPQESVIEDDDGASYVQRKVSETEDVTISVNRVTEYSEGQNESVTEVEAVADNLTEWGEISEIAEELVGESASSISITIYWFQDIIESEMLEYFVEKPVKLHIVSRNGSVWEIDMSQMTLSSFTGQYILDEMATNPIIKAETSNNPEEQTGLQEIESTESEVIYEKYDPNAVVPNDTVEGDSHLTDANGTTYYVTKRSSKWGITGTQFALYVGFLVGSAVLIVAVVMISLNKIKKANEEYEELAKRNQEER